MNYDNESIEVITPYTYEESKAFLRFHSRKSAYFGYVVIAGYALFVIYEIVTTGSSDNRLWGGLIVGAALFNIVISNGVYFTRNAYERTHRNISKGFKYLFKNDEVVLINLLTADDTDVGRDFGHNQAPAATETEPAGSAPTLPKGWNVLPYANILKIAEAKNAYYIYVNRNIAFIVSKDGFVTGKTYGFVTLMEEKLGKRFRQIKTKD
ncbi:MAG: YcxB family protein [Defluviitaleaceae bacterium]|nr:YcxB family protein [Defluviitaleaceae bacterium]